MLLYFGFRAGPKTSVHEALVPLGMLPARRYVLPRTCWIGTRGCLTEHIDLSEIKLTTHESWDQPLVGLQKKIEEGIEGIPVLEGDSEIREGLSHACVLVTG